jgi:glycosyltransferase involved in cell wall biosynthesis
LSNDIFTILIPLKTNASALVQTLQSIENLCGSEADVLIGVDNSLRDQDYAFVSRYPFVSVVKIESQGLYCAMNDLVANCRAKYFAIMGAGDLLLHNPMDDLVAAADPPFLVYDSIFGSVAQSAEDFFSKWRQEKKYFTRRIVPFHASVVMKTEIGRNEKFDERYKIISDALQLERVLIKFDYSRGNNISTTLISIDESGVSSSVGSTALHLRELLDHGLGNGNFIASLVLVVMIIWNRIKKLF